MSTSGMKMLNAVYVGMFWANVFAFICFAFALIAYGSNPAGIMLALISVKLVAYVVLYYKYVKPSKEMIERLEE